MAMASHSPDGSAERIDVVIRENYTYLVRNLRTFELLTSRHSFIGIISDELESKIMAKEIEEKQAGAKLFINAFLKSKEPGKGRVLKKALKAPEHDLVRKMLFEEDTDESVAHANEQELLKHHRALLLENVHCDEMLISMCLSENLISQPEAEEIRARNTNFGESRGICRLLDSVQKAHDFYTKFLKILWDLDRKKLVKKIDRTEYEKLRAKDEDGGSILVNAISFDSDSYSSGVTGGNLECTDDNYISRNSSYPDVEKGETKHLNAYNILPENNLNDGPVSSRTRSKTKLLNQDHPSRDSNGTGTTKDSENVSGNTKKKIFGFQSPPPTSVHDKNVRAGALSPTNCKKVSYNGADPITSKQYTEGNDHKGTLTRIKQGHTHESLDEEDANDRSYNLEYRYPHVHQDVKYRDERLKEQNNKHRTKAMHGSDEEFYKKRDLTKPTNNSRCPCGELCKDDIQLQVHSKSPICPLNAMRKGATSPEIAPSKRNFGFQSSKTLSLDFVPDSLHRDSQSRLLKSPPPNRDTPSHRLESPPPFLGSPTKRCVSPPPHRDSQSRLLKSPPPNRDTPSHRLESPPPFIGSPTKRCVSPPPHRDSPSRLLKSPPPHGDSPSHRLESPPPFLESPTKRCVSPSPLGDAVTKDLTQKQTIRQLKDRILPRSLDEKPVQVFRCRQCKKSFKTEQKLKTHMENKDCGKDDLQAKHHQHSRSTGKEKKASAENYLSHTMKQIQPYGVISPPSGVMSHQMTSLSRVMPLPSTEGHRTQSFRCTCDKVFGQKEKLDKHKTEGNCEDLKTSKNQRVSGSASFLNERPANVFRCSECTLTFSNEQALKLHIVSKHK